MNKRIKELLDQCTDQTMTKPWPLIDAEKFAELIVGECIENIEQFDHHITPAMKVVPTIVSQIKQHFGVEE